MIFIFKGPVDTLHHVQLIEQRSHVISLRICLLTTQDLDADPFPEDDWPCDPRPFYPDAEWHVETLVGKVNSVAQVEKLIASNEFDLFFNLCDGAADQDIPGIEVIQKMEAHGVPFAGASSECYEPTRVEMKEACKALGIATPAFGPRCVCTLLTMPPSCTCSCTIDRCRFSCFTHCGAVVTVACSTQSEYRHVCRPKKNLVPGC